MRYVIPIYVLVCQPLEFCETHCFVILGVYACYIECYRHIRSRHNPTVVELAVCTGRDRFFGQENFLVAFGLPRPSCHPQTAFGLPWVAFGIPRGNLVTFGLPLAPFGPPQWPLDAAILFHHTCMPKQNGSDHGKPFQTAPRSGCCTANAVGWK